MTRTLELAEKHSFLGLVRKELKKKAKEDGNLFLFVSDHGMPNQDKHRNWDPTYSINCNKYREKWPDGSYKQVNGSWSRDFFVNT
ncbi:MAG: hypothetical protein EBX52_02780 [Proteobacteria bacterium]|nr:hypothetical protein [Pseudomonadota bacterium]